MLGIATLQQEAAGASEGTVAYTLAAIKDWTFLLGRGVYCTIWGFRRDAPILSESAR